MKPTYQRFVSKFTGQIFVNSVPEKFKVSLKRSAFLRHLPLIELFHIFDCSYYKICLLPISNSFILHYNRQTCK